ncbi:Cytochrome c oxidase assembly protein cox15 [Tulasnella sp. 424]|nr:Cytochrome c oxidase assembly protein cox15 [Tulasnella sp. 424]KAG8977018.1 Cytochrome c oxidase assembly protein cox15 [Tulasnella sp. 425]
MLSFKPGSTIFQPVSSLGHPNGTEALAQCVARYWFSEDAFKLAVKPANDVDFALATESAADHGEEAASKETLTPPSVYKWLFGCSLLVFSVVVVGGVTRLTESGLSITEWRPVAGTIPPITRAEWEVEFDKYKATPEYKLLNHGITLEQFKSIFYMEWGHRVLGRLIGLVYVLPMVYFISTRRVPRKLTPTLAGLGLLLGFQGFLGWYMVKSGLEDSIMETPGAVPRVSQYRLAAHLTAALLLYAGMLSTAMSVRTEWRYGNGYGIPGLSTAKPKAFNADALRAFLATKVGRRFKVGAWGLLGLIFTTAISGAFVAGLDAGLLYNEFPLMGGRLAPPSDELFSKAYAKRSDGSDLWWRNIFENPTTVQFDHRCLAITTYFSTLGMFLATKYHAPLRAVMPALTQRAVTAVFHAANLQVLLGISTLLYLVPVPLAAAHQAGSVVLLSCALGLLASLRRPGAVAKAWRQIKVNSLKRTSASGSSTSGSP